MRRFITFLAASILGLYLTASSAVARPEQTGFGWPIQPPTIVSAFDPPANPYGPGHRGVDLAATADRMVYAAGAGRVIYAGTLAGRGVISIEHAAGLRTTYEPIQPLVVAGEHVLKGQAIGLVLPGHPRCDGQLCLHWGAKLGERYLDPARLITGWRVRLLPWHAT